MLLTWQCSSLDHKWKPLNRQAGRIQLTVESAVQMVCHSKITFVQRFFNGNFREISVKKIYAAHIKLIKIDKIKRGLQKR